MRLQISVTLRRPIVLKKTNFYPFTRVFKIFEIKRPSVIKMYVSCLVMQHARDGYTIEVFNKYNLCIDSNDWKLSRLYCSCIMMNPSLNTWKITLFSCYSLMIFANPLIHNN